MAIPLTATGSPEVEVNKNAERASLIQGGLNLFRVYGIDHSFVSKVYNRILRGLVDPDKRQRDSRFRLTLRGRPHLAQDGAYQFE
jgi:hypothetical protein